MDIIKYAANIYVCQAYFAYIRLFDRSYILTNNILYVARLNDLKEIF